MKKIFAALLMLAFAFASFAQTKTYSAEELKKEALKKDSLAETINYISSRKNNMSSEADKRSILYYLGTLQEQNGDYSAASSSYASAAGIAAGDAKNMAKISSEELVLCAVLSSLNAGEAGNASSYLASSVSKSENVGIQARVKLYSAWADLCKAQSLEATKETQALLKAYSTMDSMKSLHPQILFTLWYLTDSKEYSDLLKSKFPSSPENRIVTGKTQLMASPFWLFMPHAEHEATKTSATVISSNESSSSSQIKLKYLQLGLFREKANADALVSRAKAKGFNAHYYTETRASGTTYYIVVVDENAEGNMSLKLKDAGFENYPLYE